MAVTPLAAVDAVADHTKTTPAPAPDELAVAAATALTALDDAAKADGSDEAGAEPVGGDTGSEAPAAESGTTTVPVTDGGATRTDPTGNPVTESGEAAEGDESAESTPEDPVAASMRAVADLVAKRGGVEADALIEVWSTTTDQRYRVVLAALAQVGDGYRYASAGPDLFDCSGLSKYAWGTVGVSLFHNSKRQIDAAFPKDKKDLLPGDLVWRPGHVMVYLGVGELIVNAVQPGKVVEVKKWGKVYRFGSPIKDEPPAEPVTEPAA